MYCIGIDPGASGCAAALLDNHAPAYCRFKNSTRYDIVHFLRGYAGGEVHVALEQVASSPQMGVTSSFTFGRGFGWIEGVLMALELPYTYVRPQVWQKDLSIPKRGKKTKTEHKRLLADTARTKFPEERELTLDQADALLIAYWCRHHCPETQQDNHDTK